ncbi:MAG: helicase-related protein [Flavobacteriaceae bacterium]|nr:helicase-related protein [Flavobacteriaceae bacterium]
MDIKTQEFLQKIKERGHWNNDFDYSQVEYKNAHTNIKVICKIHGEFFPSPQSFIRGSGCMKCYKESRVGKSKFNQNDIINEFKKVHGNRYNYSKVKFLTNNEKIIIVCSKHGEFLQAPKQHKKGAGCPACAGNIKFNTEIYLKELKNRGFWNNNYDYSEVNYVSMKKLIKIRDKTTNIYHLANPWTILNKGSGLDISNAENKTEYALFQMRKVHGDRYDYSKSKYSSKEKLKIICRIHGEFKQSYHGHIAGKGCNKCGNTIIGNKLIKTLDEVLHEFKEIHGNEYDYSQVEYKGGKQKIKIICEKHGVFEQTPDSHKKGSGCPTCAGKNITQEETISEFIKTHKNRYDYSLVKYTTATAKVKIICEKHGVFEQSPISHKRGAGCPLCSGGVLLTSEQVISQFKEVHGNKYDYSLVDYVSIHKPVKIICQKHGVFEQAPSVHKRPAGCPTCGLGWNVKRILNFINDIRNEDVLSMDPVELNMLIAQGKLPKELEELVFSSEGTGEHSLKTLKEKLGFDDNTENNEDEFQRISEELEVLTSSENQDVNEALMAIEPPSIEELELATIEERENENLPSISNSDILVLDKELINTCDDEAVEFFIQYKLKKVWNEIINEKRNADDIKLLKGGKNSTRLRELFLEEYDKVVNYIPPQGYSFEREGKIAPPNMMQKLTVQRIKDYKRYGNWSGTGAGKTISFIIASREVESRITLVICLNSTISQLQEDILEVYPDSLVHTRFRKGQKFDRTRYNYLLLNYEKFQQGYTEERFQDLNENNLVDFIVLDEIHNTKQRDKDESKRRGAVMRLIGRSAEMNPNFHLLGMSATPVINNLIEAKSLLQLITGKEYYDISTRGTITNALKVFNQLLLNGIRYIPKYNIVLKELTGKNTEKLNIDGESLVESLKSNNSKDYLGLEKILLEPKLDSIKGYLKPKTILYTYFTDGNKIPLQIAKYVKSQGYSVGLYIGEQSTEDREISKDSFVKGSTDILIASRTIGTGVDGLQNVCNRMILLTLPWTDSEYTQLKGRIYRQGSKFGDVEIIIPQVYVDLDDQRWSWDKQRLQLIRDKRTLADAAVDGIIPSKHIPTREKLCSDSLQALRKWKERVNEGKITIVAREDLVLPLRPEIIESLSHRLGDFSQLNQTWSVSRSENTFKRLKKDKSEWYYYHSLYSEKRKEWDEIPYEEIAKDLKGRPDWIIADMGCGENLLSKEIENKVYAFDYVALEGEDVVECDITNVPLDDHQVDAVVFSLSLMGSNHTDYLREGSRILKPYGSLFICEPKKKAESRMENLKKEIEDSGFKIIDIKPSSQFVYINAVKI